ncbi:MAG: PhzF family phenazine biosynthesis protein [Telluria sp.]
MQLREVKCFGVSAGEGNAALVVQGGPADQAGRQAFARRQDVSACVFIDGDVLDFYYPHMRSPLCLHATLAAAPVLFAQQGSDAPIVVKTAMHGQRLALSREGDEVFVGLRRQAVAAVAPPLELIAELLGAPVPLLIPTPVVASVGSPKLLVEVTDSAALQGLRPDLARIVAWGKAAGINGIYVYCRIGAGVYEGRNFNHLDPVMEDSATGVAAGALTVVLGCGMSLYQGARRCMIRTRLDGETILIGGRA